jgi:hypothetical protein
VQWDSAVTLPKAVKKAVGSPESIAASQQQLKAAVITSIQQAAESEVQVSGAALDMIGGCVAKLAGSESTSLMNFVSQKQKSMSGPEFVEFEVQFTAKKEEELGSDVAATISQASPLFPSTEKPTSESPELQVSALSLLLLHSYFCY